MNTDIAKRWRMEEWGESCGLLPEESVPVGGRGYPIEEVGCIERMP